MGIEWLEVGIKGWFIISFVASIAAIFAGYIVALIRTPEGQTRLRERMGTGSWKFSESWASTLTASGAVLGLILAVEVLPKKTEIPKDDYVMLELMFGVIVVAATLFYNAIRWPKEVAIEEEEIVETVTREQTDPEKTKVEHKKQKKKAVENMGLVLFFLIASLLILWAVLGQLVTTYYLLTEIDSLPPYIDWILYIVVVVSWGLAVAYGCISIPWTLENQVHRKNRNWIVP